VTEAPSRPLRVLHLVGSPVDDFHAELSRLYARDALRATADPDRYEVVLAHVGPTGRWCFPDDLTPEALDAAPAHTLPDALARIAALEIDVALPQLFCRPGMTTYRSLLDLAGVPFVGNTAEVMALGAHKGRARAVVAAAGVRVPEGELLRPGQAPTLTPPVVVKPADADNSHGVTLVRDPAAYDAALAAAREVATDVLVERYVELGREVRCGVLEVGDELVCLPLEEYAVDATSKPIRDAADKLARTDDGELRLVAKDTEHAWLVELGDPVTARVHAAARAAHRALGCRDYSLFDFRIDPDGEPWFLEAGLYCSYAEQSVVAVMAGAAGYTVPDLLAQGVRQALARGPVPGAGWTG
jgi:D-alanine-D-alanine ligase